MFQNLQADILELFADAQRGINLGLEYATTPGFHTVWGQGGARVPALSPEEALERRRTAKREWWARSRTVASRVDRRVAVRQALLAGERPKWKKGDRGRPPTLWIEIAKELGINLGGES